MRRFAKKRSKVRGERVEQGNQLFAGLIRDDVLVVLLERFEFALPDFLA